jgi:hypothetical protein
MKKNTNTYKSILGLSAVAALIGTPAAVMANQVTLAQNNYSYGDAGEFTASGTGVNPSALGYASSTSTSGTSATFETFCVETEVAFNNGGTYNYTTGAATGNSSSAENDGGGISSPNPQGGTPLSEGAAFLYYEFATGGLGVNYNYANTGINSTGSNSRQNEAGELQIAIWYFMGELTVSSGMFSSLPFSLPAGMSSEVSSDPFITLAENALGNGNTTNGYTDAILANGVGGTDYGVAIMQLTTPGNSNEANQNQLILTVPDGGITLAMLGMGLAGLFFVNFKRTKSVAKQN